MMKLNCEKDDLARIVRATLNPEYLGHIVRCIEPFIASRGPAWVVDPPIPDFSGVLDSALRPLRNPGPDEVDEMVKLLGAPEGRTPVLIGQGAEA
jgi:hypothetical protein